MVERAKKLGRIVGLVLDALREEDNLVSKEELVVEIATPTVQMFSPDLSNCLFAIAVFEKEAVFGKHRKRAMKGAMVKGNLCDDIERDAVCEGLRVGGESEGSEHWVRVGVPSHLRVDGSPESSPPRRGDSFTVLEACDAIVRLCHTGGGRGCFVLVVGRTHCFLFKPRSLMQPLKVDVRQAVFMIPECATRESDAE